jgi:hypothetical protein
VRGAVAHHDRQNFRDLLAGRGNLHYAAFGRLRKGVRDARRALGDPCVCRGRRQMVRESGV